MAASQQRDFGKIPLWTGRPQAQQRELVQIRSRKKVYDDRGRDDEKISGAFA